MSVSFSYSAGMKRSKNITILQRLRKSRGWIQRDLAQKLGVTSAAVTQWEAGGGIETAHVVKLAALFKCEVGELIDADGKLRVSTNPENDLGLTPEKDTIVTGFSPKAGEDNPADKAVLSREGRMQDLSVTAVITRQIGELGGEIKARLTAIEARLDELGEQRAGARGGPRKGR